MKRSSAATYNLITGLFGILTLFSCICVGALLLVHPSFLGRQVAQVPTSIVAPTDTKTYTPSATFTPSITFTPSYTPTPLATDTIVPTNTLVPTETPPPTDVSTDTPTPKNTPAIVATAVPTLSAAGSYAFVPGSNAPAFSPNPDSTTGCNVMAIAGQILDQNNKPITAKVEVYIAGPKGFKKLAKPNPVNVAPYGVGFWLLVINSKVNSNAYVVEVLDSKGTQISSPMTVQFTADCQNNVALIDFIQTGPITLP